jgi:hypothetical protein
MGDKPADIVEPHHTIPEIHPRLMRHIDGTAEPTDKAEEKTTAVAVATHLIDFPNP